MALKIRALVKFPSRVLASTGVSVTKANGIWTFGLNLGALQALASLPDEELDNLGFVVYNSDTEANARLPLDVFLDAMTDAVAEGLDPTLVAIAGLSPSADQMIYWTGADVAAMTGLTAAGRALLDDADAAAQLTTLGVSAFVQTILDDADAATVRATISAAASGANTDLTSVYLNNTGLKIKDTNASHGLTIKPDSDLTADRIYTIVTGDSDRTVTLSGNPTLNDWFDQSVKQAASPTFAGLTLSSPLAVGQGGTGQTTAAEAIGELVQALTEDMAPVPSLDMVGTYDDSADTGKKVTLERVMTTARGIMGYVTNRYYGGEISQTGTTTTFVVAANLLYAVPFFVGKKVTWTRIGIDVTASAGTNARLGIYKADGTGGTPSTLVVDAGTVSTASTGIKEATISQALEVGMYWVTAVFDNTPTVRGRTTGVSAHDFLSAIMGGATPGTQDLLMHVAHAFGALPSPYGTLTFNAGATMPLIMMRVV